MSEPNPDDRATYTEFRLFRDGWRWAEGFGPYIGRDPLPLWRFMYGPHATLKEAKKHMNTTLTPEYGSVVYENTLTLDGDFPDFEDYEPDEVLVGLEPWI